jgi:hypothetical protein
MMIARQMEVQAGRDPAALPVTTSGVRGMGPAAELPRSVFAKTYGRNNRSGVLQRQCGSKRRIMARKSDAQSFISVEDFWGGILIGLLIGYTELRFSANLQASAKPD